MNTLPTNSEYITCHAVPQQKLIDYARKIFELAKNGKTVEASFNKLTFFVTQEKFKTPEDIASFYFSENLKRDEEYKRSPEYKQRAEEAKKQLRNKQNHAKEQEEKLLTITCQNPEKNIDWIEKNRNNIFFMDKEKIQNHFKKMINTWAYKTPTENEYQKYIEDKNHIKIFEYIIFLVLQDLNNFSSIHYRIQSYIKDWKTCQK